MMATQVRAVTRAPGAGSLQVSEVDVPPPPAGEVRVRVEAAGVSYGDLLFQRGVVPGGPKIPFVPGCDLTGTVESVGTGVTDLSPGVRVTALLPSGGYATVANVPAHRLVPVPAGVEPSLAAAVSLNYFIAHQMLHRVAGVRPGAHILVHGASGGVGSAFLQLAERIGDVTVWGTCSPEDADFVRAHGAIPIDYHRADFVGVVRSAGSRLDAVFDPIGGVHFRRSYGLLGRGGTLVAYGQSDALRNGKPDRVIGAVGFVGGILLPKLIPDGRSTVFYNAWSLEKEQPAAYRQDLTHVLLLAAAGDIAPRQVTVVPLAHAPDSFVSLQQGMRGKMVLDCAATHAPHDLERT